MSRTPCAGPFGLPLRSLGDLAFLFGLFFVFGFCPGEWDHHHPGTQGSPFSKTCVCGSGDLKEHWIVDRSWCNTDLGK